MQKFLSLGLATLVLLGSAGVTLSRHFCKGELKSVAIFGKAEKCHQDQAVKHCPFHPPPPAEEEEGIQQKGCCDDDQLILQVEDQEPLQPKVEMPAVVALLPAFPPLLSNYLAPHPRPRKNTNFENYRPPPLLPDVVREYQVFRL